MPNKPSPPPNSKDPRFGEWLFTLWDWVVRDGRIRISQLSTEGVTANQVIASDTANSALVGKTMTANSPLAVAHSNTAITLTHFNSGVTAGQYGNASAVPQFNVNVTGHVELASNVSISIIASQVSDFTEAAQDATGNMVVGTGNVPLTYNDSVPSLTADLSSTGVTAGTYGNGTVVGQITVDAAGRITAASNVSISTVLYPYAKANLPAANVSTYSLVYVTDETGGAVPAFSDGTDWRRVTDRAVVS